MGGDKEGKREKSLQGTYIKDTWTKTRCCRIKGGRLGWLGLGGSGWREMETIVLEQQ